MICKNVKEGDMITLKGEEMEKTKRKRVGIVTEVEIALKNDIGVPVLCKNSQNIIRGIYGFFAVCEDKEHCLYIGRSYDISGRIFGSDGHVTKYNHQIKKNLVPHLIDETRKHGWKVDVRILEIVKYKGDNYYRDMQRLAYAEYRLIEEYQKKERCLYQLPEGTWMKKKNWDANYSKKKIEN